ncbi:hypothetical protein BC749_101356 [Flavobacterium araucananum]|nr:hypothetical protein [Flavobacterium araucananum]PWK02292.1 hypothetical protein BC749_101356 [Flavobacterium araucananum]
MKKNLFCKGLILIALLFSINIEAQMTIGGKKAPEPYSVLELANKGGLRLPQMTTAQRNALGATALDAKSHGLFIYNTTTTCIEYWDSVRWVSLCDGTSQTVLSPAPCTTVNADGTGCASTFTATDIDCPNGPYDIAIVTGSEYATLSNVDYANGSFGIVFNENSSINEHTVLIRVTSSCTAMYKEFLFSQKGVDCTALTYAVPTISPATANLGLCAGGAVYLSVPANTPNLDQLIWTRNGVEVARGVSKFTATIRGKYNVSMAAAGCNVNIANERNVTDSGSTISSSTSIFSSNNGILCGTNSVTLTATGSTGTVSWFHDGKEDGRTGATVVLTGDNSVGEWFAVSKDGTCYSMPSNSVLVTKSGATGQVAVNPNDVLVNGVPLNTFNSFCMGGLLDLVVNNKLPGVTYTWYNGNEVISSNPFVVPNTQSNISLRMIAADNSGVNCPAEASVVEKAITGGTAPAQPNITGNSTLCDGTTDLTIVPAVAGTYTYTWYKDNAKMPDTTPTITVNTPGVVYTATVTNATGCVSEMAVKVIAANVSSIPKLTWQSQTTTATFGAKVTLQTAIEFGPALTYTWAADNGATIVGSTSSVTIQMPASGTDGVTVNVTVSATNNCGKSEVLSLPIVLNNACPAPALAAQSALSQNVTAGSSITVAVTGTKLNTPTYQWYLNTTASTTGGTVLPSATLASYAFSPTVAGTYYLYCIVTNGCAGNFTAVSPVFTAIVTANPAVLPIGTGVLAGRTCFDVAESNDNAGCGLLTMRKALVTMADFNQTATNTQTYTFTPNGTVSKVRFVYVESLGGSIVSSFVNNGDPAAVNISTPVTATIVYKSNLSSANGIVGTANGKSTTNAFTLDVFVIYNNNAAGTGVDVQQKLTVSIKDCSCCGAYIAPNTFRVFMCHNLGADVTKDPFTPSAAIGGDYYQWGQLTPRLKQGASTDAVSGWTSTVPADRPVSNWGPAPKKANDPCPSGFRIPSQEEFNGLNANNVITGIGKRSSSDSNYFDFNGVLAGNAGYNYGGSLFFPLNGSRIPMNGMSSFNNQANYGGVWLNNGLATISSTYVSKVYPGSTGYQNAAYAVRCMSEN